MHLRPTRRIEEAVAGRLVEKFSGKHRHRRSGSRVSQRFSANRTDSTDVDSDPEVTVDEGGTTLRVSLGHRVHELDRDRARQLRDALSGALTERREYVHTVCEHREDGAYVVERRGSTSSGHRKVFDSFDLARQVFQDLPEEFTAEDISAAGVSGGRRHMLVWHFAERPAFDCRLVSRQPLTVQKTNSNSYTKADANSNSTTTADHGEEVSVN